ncbi:MAG TPA: alpha/beta hydrolase [Actinomycetota bacterium]|nr:alpha/beta hydrolase [Actinomycetota bacterium]
MADGGQTPSAQRIGASAILSYVGGLITPAPRLVGFAISEGRRARVALKEPSQDSAAIPPLRLTPSLLALAALDEWTVAVMKTPGRMPTEAGFERVTAEISAAHELYDRRGWIADPPSFHAAPPPLVAPMISRSRLPGVGFEHVSFESEYEPDPQDPGRERWLSYEANRTGHAWVLRHVGAEDRPWVVCLHAFGMGYPYVDLWGFRAMWLHRVLGLNVAFPIAPLHGPRRIGRLSGAAFMTYNLVDIVHGFAQAVWDTRRVLGWIRAQGGTTVGLYGVSMGAHLSGILAGLDPDLSFVLSAFPTCNLTDLFIEHGPRNLRKRAEQHGLISEEAEDVHRLVSPLGLPAVVPTERLFICAGLADRMATPAQAHKLWLHWGMPRIAWFNSNHVAFMWRGEVGGFVQEALQTSGLL